jgi:hypothetical protein
MTTEETTTPQAGAGTGDQESQAESPQAGGSEQQDMQALLAELKQARKEAASYRTKLRQTEESEAERKRQEMTEVERLKADLETAKAKADEAQRTAQERLLRAAVTTAAAKANFADPDDAWRFIDATTLEVGDGGAVNGLDEAIQAIAKAKPYLLRPTGTQQHMSATNPANPTAKSDEQMRQEMFGRKDSNFWKGGGVVHPND